jgi:hypothetical protein
MQRISKHLIFLVGIVVSVASYGGATDCRNEWVRPTTQTMSMDSAISFTLTDYKNGERHFSVKQAPGQQVDIYYLKGAVLAKGYSQEQLEKLAGNALFMMPMAFAVPIAISAQVAPKGPCAIEKATPFSTQLSGVMKLQDRKITSATGQLQPSALSEISYELDAVIDPPAPNKTSVHYAGSMSFAPQEGSAPDNNDISGFLLLSRSRPFPIAGSAGIPTTIGELRRFIASRQPAPNAAANTDAAR